MEEIDKYLRNCGKDTPHLHPWRMIEILHIILDLFKNVDAQTFDFSGRTIAQKLGIKVKPYSSFTSEHLQTLQTFNTSYWKEGLCVSFDNKKAIYYNDTCECPPNERWVMCEFIINHELAHLILQHTEQCTIAEEEAIFFTAIMSLLTTIFQTLKLQNMLTNQTLNLFINNILNGMNKSKEVVMTETKAKGAL